MNNRTEQSQIQKTFGQLPGVRGLVGLVKKVKGLSTNWWLQNSNGDVEFSIGNTVDNILTTMYGAIRV